MHGSHVKLSEYSTDRVVSYVENEKAAAKPFLERNFPMKQIRVLVVRKFLIYVFDSSGCEEILNIGRV